MRDVIIASANRKSAEHIKSILQRDLLFVSEIYQSGAEVLSYASIRPDAVVVCGRLSDGLPAVSLAETLPPGFDVVHLVSSSDAYQGFVSNMVELTMPLDRVEFVSVVRTLTQLSSDITSRKKTTLRRGKRPFDAGKTTPLRKLRYLGARGTQENSENEYGAGRPPYGRRKKNSRRRLVRTRWFL